ncbi:hypothetical protein QQP08_024037 [Theobroma cacao]|nr:hypothetical protein QQP08_024037 [Theobroma cacao]
MLQWMGGSRRKVTTNFCSDITCVHAVCREFQSRKSTQKRQKQYFEQRKREQQQQMAGSEGYTDETSIHGKHQKEYRSLDILSLLNLSTVPEEGRSCPSRRDGKTGALKMKYHIPKDPPTIITNSVPPYAVEIKEAGAPPSSCQSELQYPKVSFFGHDNRASNGINNSPDLSNAASEKQFSVFDMLSDDASGDTLERSLVHEAHAAFSIEGLGKIRAETPPHSPKQQGRISSDDCAFPWNIARQLNSSKNSNYVLNDLELEMDAMMQDINMPLVGKASEFSLGKTDLHGNWRTNLSTVTDHMQLDSHYSNRECTFGDTNIFSNIRRREDTSDARLSFLDDDFLHERKEDVSWKYWPHKIDAGDFLEYDKGEMSDYAFEGHHVLKKRDVKATKFNSLGPPSPKHTTSEIGRDFTTLIDVSHTPVQRNVDIRGLPGQPDWSYFETEDAKDNLRLPSEESCSSSAG